VELLQVLYQFDALFSDRVSPIFDLFGPGPKWSGILKTFSVLVRSVNPRFQLLSLASGAVESRGSIKDLLKNPMRITTALLWIIWFSCAFSYYGIVLLTTEILTDSKEGTCDANDKCSFNCADLDKVRIYEGFSLDG